MINNFEIAVDLQMFAEGIVSAASGVSASDNTGAPALPASDAGVKKDKMQGDSAAAAPDGTGADNAVGEANPPAEALPDRKAEYRRMLAEYKDLDDERVQSIVRDRLKGTKETVGKYNALAPVLDMLGKKYGIDASDAEALSKAILDDDSYYEAEAMERGISVEQLKTIRKMERENDALRRQMREKESRENASRIYAGWMEQAEAAKAVYPSLDLKAELADPRFADLLRSNIDVKTAYEVIHKDEIIPAAMQFAAKTATEKMAAGIASGRNRPAENGTKPQSASTVKIDVSKMTKAERADINRRVARGEKITL